MEAVLDTNFVISCVMKKIDFMDELKNMGFVAIVPREVLEELKDLKKESRTSHQEREAIDVALDIFSEKGMKKMKLGSRTVDEGLIAKGKTGAYIATLDNGIKKTVPNKIVVNSATKKLAIERD